MAQESARVGRERERGREEEKERESRRDYLVERERRRESKEGERERWRRQRNNEKREWLRRGGRGGDEKKSHEREPEGRREGAGRVSVHVFCLKLSFCGRG